MTSLSVPAEKLLDANPPPGLFALCVHVTAHMAMNGAHRYSPFEKQTGTMHQEL